MIQYTKIKMKRGMKYFKFVIPPFNLTNCLRAKNLRSIHSLCQFNFSFQIFSPFFEITACSAPFSGVQTYPSKKIIVKNPIIPTPSWLKLYPPHLGQNCANATVPMTKSVRSRRWMSNRSMMFCVVLYAQSENPPKTNCWKLFEKGCALLSS